MLLNTHDLKKLARRILNYNSAVKPNFLGIGAAKAGTTSLAKILSQHPQISIPRQKELHFFDEEHMLGPNDLDTYYSQFRANQVVGEITPSYLFVPESAKRIHDTLGRNIKFIVALRNPVDRAYSHYFHAINNWREERFRKLNYPIETLQFEDALDCEKERLSDGKYHMRHLSYFSKGLYAEQLLRYFQYYPRNQFYIYLFEEFIVDGRRVIADICNFLGVDASFSLDSISVKTNSQTNSILPAIKRKILYQRYKRSIDELEVLLERDLSLWRET